MGKFKVGDRVKFRDDYESSARGKEATVIKIDEWGVQVDMDSAPCGISTERPSDLRLVAPATSGKPAVNACDEEAPTTIADIVRRLEALESTCKPAPLMVGDEVMFAAPARITGFHKENANLVFSGGGSYNVPIAELKRTA